MENVERLGCRRGLLKEFSFHQSYHTASTNLGLYALGNGREISETGYE